MSLAHYYAQSLSEDLEEFKKLDCSSQKKIASNTFKGIINLLKLANFTLLMYLGVLWLSMGDDLSWWTGIALLGMAAIIFIL